MEASEAARTNQENSGAGTGLSLYKKKTSFETLEERKLPKSSPFIHNTILCVVELELERAETFLKQRFDRKREFRAKTLEMNERNRRKWLVQKGKEHMLNFDDK